MTSIHERKMLRHGAGGMSGNHKGMPKDITSYEITLKGKRQIAEGTYEFTFSKPANFEYKAGQHGRMTLIDPPETDAEGDARFLSFASYPDESDLMFAMRMRDTAFKRVLSRLQPGSKVLWQMRKTNPHGSFALQDATDAAKPAVFLIGGIGIVPIFSMIKDALANGAQHKITLIYSNRRPEDAPYLEELQNLAKKHPSEFTLVPTMTESEKSAQNWKGETGVISKDMLQKWVKNLQAPIYYVAGLTDMVSAMKKLLADLGVDPANIRAEEFGAFSGAHSKDPTRNNRIWAVSIIAAVIILMVVVHLVGASWVEKALNSQRHIELQVAIGLILLMLIVIYFKIKLVRKHLRGRGQT